jgi:hypothetical protein
MTNTRNQFIRETIDDIQGYFSSIGKRTLTPKERTTIEKSLENTLSDLDTALLGSTIKTIIKVEAAALACTLNNEVKTPTPEQIKEKMDKYLSRFHNEAV